MTRPTAYLSASAVQTDGAVDAVTRWWQTENMQSWLIDKPIGIALILIVAIIGRSEEHTSELQSR